MNKRSAFSYLRKQLSYLMLISCLHATSATAQEACERTGIDFGFFNGVQTKLDFAQDIVERTLPELYGTTTPDGQPITYTLYYNDTDAGLADFVETFEQRMQEQEGLLAGRFELFFSALQGGRFMVGPHTRSGASHR